MGAKLIALSEYAEALGLSSETVRRRARKNKICAEAIMGAPVNGYVIHVEEEVKRLEAVGAPTYARKLREYAASRPDRPIEDFMNRRGRTT